MEKLKKAKNRIFALICAAVVMCSSCAVFAEEGGSAGTANAAVTTAMNGVASDMVATINSIIPIALTVVGIGLVVMAGIRIFKKVAKPS